MQVFIIGTALETAKILDRLRLNKQIIECQQILDALNGKKAWSNHPCTLQYKEHQKWLVYYMNCLSFYIKGDTVEAGRYSYLASTIKPEFHTSEYLDQMKRRLYTKNNKHYSQWKDLGESQINWYFVNGEWKYYLNGKQIKHYND